MNLPPFSKEIYQRPFDSLLKNKKDLLGAEIGIWRGYHAFLMFQVLDIKKLYLIDPWIDYSGYIGNDSFKYAQKFLKDYSDKVNFIRKTSEEAVKSFDDESLDFVYIDGNHNYKHVKQDIHLWTPKVKEGGIVSGHDYDGAFSGVIKAVKEYTAKHNIKYKVRGKKQFKNYTSFSDWAFKKGGEIERWEDETNN